jgi:hypothetical protein
LTSPSGQGRPDGALLALAKEVEQLRRTLERVEQLATSAKETAETAARNGVHGSDATDDVSQLRVQLGEVALQVRNMTTTVNGMAEVATQVTGLSDQVMALAERLTSGEADSESAAPALPSWFEIEGERAQQMLADLVEWVDAILVRHYAAREALPECWMFHGEVVEDLLWLRAAWVAAHRDPDAKPHHAADFHERWLPSMMSRLRRQFGAGMCGFGKHRDGSGQYRQLREEQFPDSRVPATDPRAVETYARWWAQDRGRVDGVPPGLPTPQPPARDGRQQRDQQGAW